MGVFLLNKFDIVGPLHFLVLNVLHDLVGNGGEHVLSWLLVRAAQS